MACILPSVFEEMEQDLARQKKDILDLAELPSTERLAFFERFLDTEHAEFLNKEYEKRIMGDYTRQRLMRALDKWDEEGLKSRRKKDIIETINSNDEIFNPYTNDEFLAQLAKQKLGFAIDADTSRSLYDATQKIAAAKADLLRVAPDYETWTSDKFYEHWGKENDPVAKKMAAYGSAVVEYDLLYKVAALKGAIAKNPKLERISRVLGTAKSFTATGDMSVPRQMFPLLWVNPSAGLKAFTTGAKVQWNFSRAPKESGNAVMAMIYSMPNFMNGRMREAGVDVGGLEEAFPENIISQGEEWVDNWLASKGIKLGKDGFFSYIALTERAEQGYKLTLQLFRAEEFNRMYELNEANGGTFEQLLDQNIGGYINSSTGRAEKVFNIKDPNAAKFINISLFAPRYWGATIERILNVRYIPTDIKTIVQTKSLTVLSPNQGRGRAAIGTVVFATAMMALRMLAFAWLKDRDPNTLDEIMDFFSPISTNFGKITIGDSTFDTTFGAGNNIRAVARILTMQRKNINGKTSDTTFIDELGAVLEGKSAPGFIATWNLFRLGMYNMGLHKKEPKPFGKPATLESTIKEATLPITVQNVLEQYENGGNLFSIATAANLADYFGISTQTYYPSEKDALKDPQAYKVEKQILRNVGGNKIDLTPVINSAYLKNAPTQEAFEQRSKEFTDRLKPVYDRIMLDKSIPLEEKKQILSDERAKITRDMNKKYK